MNKDKFYKQVIDSLERHNPAVKTSFSNKEAKLLAGSNIEAICSASTMAEMSGMLIRLFFDKDLTKKIKTKGIKKLALRYLVKVKNYCHTTLELARFQNDLILRKKEENPFFKLLNGDKALETIISNLGGDQNKLLDNLDIYENPVEFLGDFMVEYCNVFTPNEQGQAESNFLSKIRLATQEYFEESSHVKKESNTIKYYDKINSIIQVEK